MFGIHSSLHAYYAGDKFQPMASMPEDLIPTCVQVMNFAKSYFHPDEEYFDWVAFQNAIKQFKDGNISTNSYDQSTINQANPDAGAMVDKIVKFVHEKFSASLDVPYLSALVSAVFSIGQANSAINYRVCFAVLDDNSQSQFQSLVLTIMITADPFESNYAAKIDALKLDVKKGFKAPDN